MNEQEELVLKILSAVKVIQGKTKFVKILHFTCKLLEKNDIKSPFIFKADNFGVNTIQLTPVLEKLESQNLVNVRQEFLSKRNVLSLIKRNYPFMNKVIIGMGPKIELLVNELNQYSADEVIAYSYNLFPETTVNSKIKPKVNKKITEIFSALSPDFEESFEEKVRLAPLNDNTLPLYPQFNDLDVRIRMMKTLNLDNLPQINPDSIDEASGLITKNQPFFKKYNLKKMLEDDRRG